MKAAVRHALDGLLGLAVSALFLASVEGFLRWTQPEGETAQVSLSRGFDEEAAYLVPDPEVEGGFLTQYSDGRFPEKRFAPASDRRRVVLVGGSNTASFGTHYLQRALDERAGAGVFEVCNLGREGYGSERVRIVTQQALEQLDPDLVIVYSGHNEFVERGFRIDLDRAWEGELQTRVGDLAQRSRIISLLADRLRPKEWKEGAEDSSTEPEGSVPERHRDEYKKFAGLAWETTLDYYEAYRKNLLSIGHSCAERGVDVLYCSVVYNRFAAPFESTLRPEISSADRAEHARLRTEIEALLPLPLRRLSPEEGWEHLFHYDWIRGKGHKAPVDFPGLRPLQGVLGSTDPLLPEPKPKTRRHYRALEFLFTPLARTPEETEPLRRALELLTEALALVPDHPRSLFEFGLVSTALGDSTDRVPRAFELAGALDRAPRRGSRLPNRLAEEVARSLDAPFFDADALFAGNSPQGLVGYEFMIDECHLSRGGVHVLLDHLAAELCRE